MASNLFPVPVIERHERFFVVRDDLHPGGTKQIILRRLLPELKAHHFIYVASSFGKGGAALGFACAELGYKATLLMSRTKHQPSWIEEVQKAGTKIIWMDLLPVKKIEEQAWNHATQQNAHYLPLGFDMERFHRLMGVYARGLEITPQEIWCPIVSGTMAHALETAFPDAAIKGVSVVKHHEYRGLGQVFQAKEKFVRQAANPPPYPSWRYSDAKVWAVAKKHGARDVVIWNTNA